MASTTSPASWWAGSTFPVDAPYFSVRLAPGAGDTLTIQSPTIREPADAGFPVGSGMDGHEMKNARAGLVDSGPDPY